MARATSAMTGPLACAGMCLLACAGMCLLACASNGSQSPGQQSGKSSSEVAQDATDPGPGTDSPAPARASSADASGPGSLQVTVSWLDAPAAVRSLAGRNPCGGHYRAPVHIHTLGGVRDALVSVHALSADSGTDIDVPTPPGPVELTVAECHIAPRVVLVGAGATIEMTSLDEMRHQVRVDAVPESQPGGQPDESDAILVALPIAGVRAPVQLKQRGIFAARLVADGIDPAYVVVPGPGRHRLTDERGKASFADLAPGRYEVRVWHPPLPASKKSSASGRIRTVNAQVTVTGGQAADVEISLQPLSGGR